MKVKDIMTKDVISVTVDTKVNEVANILTEKRIHGVPVVDENKKVIGIVTETNFFAKVDGDMYLSKFVKKVEENKLPDVASLKKDEEIDSETKVIQIMTESCVTVDENMDTDNLFEVFRKKGYHTIPVADENGRLTGIVSIADIIKMTTKK